LSGDASFTTIYWFNLLAMSLDLSSFEKALASLGRGIARSRAAPGDEELRDCVIQRFEYTYELCWRMLKRRLEIDAPTPADIDQLAFKDLIRAGAIQGLIASPEAWFAYRQQRNATSHTYNEAKAVQVYEAARAFFQDAEALLVQLRQRNGNS